MKDQSRGAGQAGMRCARRCKNLTPEGLARDPRPLDTDPPHCLSPPRPVVAGPVDGEPGRLGDRFFGDGTSTRPGQASPESAHVGGIFCGRPQVPQNRLRG